MKYKICKNKTTGKYFCAVLTTSDYRNHNIKEEHYYDVDELRNARQFSSYFTALKSDEYDIIDYDTELRKIKLQKINEKA